MENAEHIPTPRSDLAWSRISKDGQRALYAEARTLERELAAKDARIAELKRLVTVDHESKAAFIARVQAVLNLPNG